jgi:arsenate reductase
VIKNSEEEKRKVLFLCIGNSCRSQMAEGFARKYGADVMEIFSGGTAPAAIVQPLTKHVMAEKNVSLDGQYPKHFSVFDLDLFDVIVNITGLKLPVRPNAEMREWDIVDPIRQSEAVYVEVRDQIESLVMRLILELRNGGRAAAPKPPDAARHSSLFRMGRRRQ